MPCWQKACRSIPAPTIQSGEVRRGRRPAAMGPGTRAADWSPRYGRRKLAVLLHRLRVSGELLYVFAVRKPQRRGRPAGHPVGGGQTHCGKARLRAAAKQTIRRAKLRRLGRSLAPNRQRLRTTRPLPAKYQVCLRLKTCSPNYSTRYMTVSKRDTVTNQPLRARTHASSPGQVSCLNRLAWIGHPIISSASAMVTFASSASHCNVLERHILPLRYAGRVLAHRSRVTVSD